MFGWPFPPWKKSVPQKASGWKLCPESLSEETLAGGTFSLVARSVWCSNRSSEHHPHFCSCKSKLLRLVIKIKSLFWEHFIGDVHPMPRNVIPHGYEMKIYNYVAFMQNMDTLASVSIPGSLAANSLFFIKLLFLSLSRWTLKRSTWGNSVTSQSKFFLETASAEQ